MSEEEKATKRLEEMTINYKLNSEDLHYAIILFNYIKNLQQEKKQLKDRINKAIEYLESLDFYKFTYPLDALDYDKNHLLEILKGGENNENRTNNKIME